MSAMGVKIDQFHFPVCNSFVSKVVNDQLCYELDPHKYIGKTDDAEDAITVLIKARKIFSVNSIMHISRFGFD